MDWDPWDVTAIRTSSPLKDVLTGSVGTVGLIRLYSSLRSSIHNAIHFATKAPPTSPFVPTRLQSFLTQQPAQELSFRRSVLLSALRSWGVKQGSLHCAPFSFLSHFCFWFLSPFTISSLVFSLILSSPSFSLPPLSSTVPFPTNYCVISHRHWHSRTRLQAPSFKTTQDRLSRSGSALFFLAKGLFPLLASCVICVNCVIAYTIDPLPFLFFSFFLLQLLSSLSTIVPSFRLSFSTTSTLSLFYCTFGPPFMHMQNPIKFSPTTFSLCDSHGNKRDGLAMRLYWVCFS